LQRKILRVQVNGEIREVPEKITLAELVSELSLAPERLAIELNREVVRRAAWPETEMREGDTIEIVHFVGGGSKEACASEKSLKTRQ
jgi:thiamine biosynthesis protein ThiS